MSLRLIHQNKDIIRSHWQGRRSTAADFLTNESIAGELVIEVSTLVDRVLLEQRDDKLVAIGVEVSSPTLGKLRIYATKEVIVSSGAYCSPAILMRSGIGPRLELERVKIPCQLDLLKTQPE